MEFEEDEDNDFNNKVKVSIKNLLSLISLGNFAKIVVFFN